MENLFNKKIVKKLWIFGCILGGIWISVFINKGFSPGLPPSGRIGVLQKTGYYSFYPDRIKKFIELRDAGNTKKINRYARRISNIVQVKKRNGLKIKILDDSRTPLIKAQWGTGEWGPEIWTMSEWVKPVKR